MTQCPSCGRPVEPGKQTCDACEAAVDASLTRTLSTPGPPRFDARRAAAAAGDNGSNLSGASSFGDARFPPGHLLDGRYRIVGLLGRGGMGEVYRAEDLKLGELVAVKFLPERLSLNGAALARFHQEVRVARQIAHRNVCRVHDIGEVDGLHYLTMEHIDGEDLSSLLRRIGRLPGDKAAELGRQVCLGLAAAHDAGILHRDLKPANIMIDGQGRAKITDFGLASLAAETTAEAGITGTPAYMAPEQLVHGDVSTATDIYALGLVLYEMFTGQRPFPDVEWPSLVAQRRESLPSSPSSHLNALDPVAERMVMRCLEREPVERPASALEVASGLPGGDPLRAALEAGETPSPQMVAEAKIEGSLPPWAILTLTMVGLAAYVCLLMNVDRWTLIGRQGLDKSHDVLVEKARQIVSEFELDAMPLDASANGAGKQEASRVWEVRDFDFDWQFVHRELLVEGEKTRRDSWAPVDGDAPPALRFWYRRSPIPLTSETQDLIDEFHPALRRPGSAMIALSPDGALLSLRALPASPNRPLSSESSARLADAQWGRLFELAELDIEAFTPVEPSWFLPLPSDERRAWQGRAWQHEIRVEAAALAGRPVAFDIVMPWTSPVPPPAVGGWVSPTMWIVFFGLVLAAGLLTWRNWRLGRGDRRGAAKLAVFFFLFGFVAVLLGLAFSQYADTFSPVFKGLIQSAGGAMILWLLYLALEPMLRRVRPKMLVSWARLLAGRWRDPIVGRDVLIGLVFCLVTTVIDGWFTRQFHLIPPLAWRLDGAMASLRVTLSWSIYISLVIAFAHAILFVVLRQIVRSDWLAAPLLVALSIFFSSGMAGFGDDTASIALQILLSTASILLLVRFGMLPMLINFIFFELLVLRPLTGDFSRFYADVTVLTTAIVVVTLLLSAWIALGQRQLLPSSFLD